MLEEPVSETDDLPEKTIHPSTDVSFTESHNKYLLGRWYMPVTIQSAKDTRAYILLVLKQIRNA